MKVDWLPDYKREMKLPNLAMAGDRFYAPAGHSETFAEYQGCVMSIDPSGRGKDETGYAILKMLNGFLYVVAAGGYREAMRSHPYASWRRWLISTGSTMSSSRLTSVTACSPN
jgi:hypothetical protein